MCFVVFFFFLFVFGDQKGFCFQTLREHKIYGAGLIKNLFNFDNNGVIKETKRNWGKSFFILHLTFTLHNNVFLPHTSIRVTLNNLL